MILKLFDEDNVEITRHDLSGTQWEMTFAGFFNKYPIHLSALSRRPMRMEIWNALGLLTNKTALTFAAGFDHRDMIVFAPGKLSFNVDNVVKTTHMA